MGSRVSFIDMNGEINLYELDVLKTVQPEDVDAVLNSGYDLVLYTCTPGGATREAAFFNRSMAGSSGENANE